MQREFFLLMLAIMVLAGCNQEPQNQTTMSGYQYTIHKRAGGEKPNPGDWVYFEADWRTADSLLFSSRNQPAGQEPVVQIPEGEDANRRLSPVEEVLPFMGVGDSATVTLKIDTMPNLPPHFAGEEFLYYDVVLTSVKSNEVYQEEQKVLQAELAKKQEAVKARQDEVAQKVENTIEQYNSGKLNSQLQTTSSGLKYIIHEEGAGDKPKPQEVVSVHYYGSLTDGEMFDNSFQRGSPIQFPLGVGRVIPGWDEGIALLNEGSSATFFVPSELGYGAQGSPPKIPGGAELVFYVELLGN